MFWLFAPVGVPMVALLTVAAVHGIYTTHCGVTGAQIPLLLTR